MKALLRASLHDTVVKMQHFICAVAATDGNWKTESTRSQRAFCGGVRIDSHCLSPSTLPN